MNTRGWAIWVLVALSSCTANEEPAAVHGGLSPDAEAYLTDVRRVDDGGYYLAPRFSPDARWLLLTGPKYRGLSVVDLESPGRVIPLCDEDYVGWPAVFEADAVRTRTRDGREVLFRFRLPLDPRHGAAVERIETGRLFDPKAATGPVHAYHEEDTIYLVRDGITTAISDRQDRYFAPRLSPDRSFLVYEGLRTGLYLYEVASRTTRAIGRGNHPAWLPDSSGLLYDVTEDDGTDLTAGDLYLYSIRGARSIQLTATADLIETHPVASADGRLVAFESRGDIYVGRLVLRSDGRR